MKENKIKVGDYVTLDCGEYSDASNTYQVVEITGDTAFLTHPLIDECCLRKPLSELNQVLAVLKNPTEKCIDFAQSHRNFLGFNLQADLDALRFYFFVNRTFSSNQKEILSFVCAKICSVLVKNDLKRAAEIVNKNTALLDDFNKIWYSNLNEIFRDITKATTKAKKSAIFRICGFIMAQLNN